MVKNDLLLGTCWIPLTDIEANSGVLAILNASHDINNKIISKFYKFSGPNEFSDSYINSTSQKKIKVLLNEWHTGPVNVGIISII